VSAAEVKRLREALSFYADRQRYRGANQRPVPGDPWTEPSASYMRDVLRDNGQIARRALRKFKVEARTDTGSKWGALPPDIEEELMPRLQRVTLRRLERGENVDVLHKGVRLTLRYV